MKKILLSALALLTLASCVKNEDVATSDTWNGELRISSGIETRASGKTWDSGDAIGVFMNLTTGDYDAVGDPNTKYTTTSINTSADFTVATNFSDLFYPASGTVDIVAHYPYNGSAELATYPVNVTTQTTPKNIDFMSAKKLDVAKSSDELNLVFYHLLSQLSITLTAATGGGLTEADLKGATVTVSGTVAEATANVGYAEGVPTATYDVSAGTAVDLSLTAGDDETSVTFIVVPQTKSVTFIITLADGKTSYSTAATTLGFTSGNNHSYTLSVSNTAVEIKGATIEDWVSSGATTELPASPFTPDIELKSDGTYYINSAKGLKAFADLVNGMENTTATTAGGVSFSEDGTKQTSISGVLTTSVSLSEYDWTPIGYYTSTETYSLFAGTFDGGGYLVSGLSVSSSNSYGGLFGYSSGTISNLGVDGTVYGSSYAGGVVGYNYGGTITNCYNLGGVGLNDCTVGGVVGNNNGGTITNCYNSGAVNGGSNNAGGVVGDNVNSSSVTNCYNSGEVSGSGNIGGVVAFNYNSTVTNCYYKTDTASYGVGNVTTDVDDNTQNLSADDMTDNTLLTDLNTNAATYNNNTDPVPTIAACSWVAGADGYPTLDFGTVTADAGTYYNPIKITNETELAALASDVNDSGYNQSGVYYIMTNDIVLSTYSSWTPIGTDNKPFAGTFDGGGYEVSGLNVPSVTNAGLFGYNSGTISNLGVSGTVAGSRVGGVVGNNSINGTVINCYNLCAITYTTGYAGGVVGYNYGTITNCYNSGTVAGATVGGVVGYHGGGTITNCYNSVSISSGINIGGVVGDLSGGTITNCYNSGTISSEVGTIGGVVGKNNIGTITGCYYKTVNELNGIGSDDNSQEQNCTTTSETEMKDGTLLDALNLYVTDNIVLNPALCDWVAGTDNYPTFNW